MRTLISQERFTWLASAAVAIAILGMAVTAQPSRKGSVDRLERLESDLRYQLELDARVNPAKYAGRTERLNTVLEAWRNSRRTSADRQLLDAWLRQALVQSLPGESGEWPAAPAFSSMSPEEHAVQKQGAPHRIAAPEPPVKPTEASKPQPSKRPTPNAASTAAGAPQASQAAKSSGATGAEVAKPFIVHISDPVPVTAETLTNDLPVKPPMAESPRQLAKLDENKEPSAPPPAPSAAETAAAYKEPSSEWNGAAPQAAVDHRLAPAPPVEVNLAELNSRIGGYHDGLREVEATIVAGRDRMTVGEFAKVVDRLESLAGQYQFVRLYYDSLTAGEREFVLEPRSMLETIELADRQRTQVESVAEEDHFGAVDREEGTELSRRLRFLLEAAAR